MAAVIGGVLGLCSLLLSIFAVLASWPKLSEPAKYVAIFIPSTFGTILIMAILYLIYMLCGMAYRYISGRPTYSGSYLPEDGFWSYLILFVVWVSVGFGLYQGAEICCG